MDQVLPVVKQGKHFRWVDGLSHQYQTQAFAHLCELSHLFLQQWLVVRLWVKVHLVRPTQLVGIAAVLQPLEYSGACVVLLLFSWSGCPVLHRVRKLCIEQLKWVPGERSCHRYSEWRCQAVPQHHPGQSSSNGYQVHSEVRKQQYIVQCCQALDEILEVDCQWHLQNDSQGSVDEHFSLNAVNLPPNARLLLDRKSVLLPILPPESWQWFGNGSAPLSTMPVGHTLPLSDRYDGSTSLSNLDHRKALIWIKYVCAGYRWRTSFEGKQPESALLLFLWISQSLLEFEELMAEHQFDL